MKKLGTICIVKLGVTGNSQNAVSGMGLGAKNLRKFSLQFIFLGVCYIVSGSVTNVIYLCSI